MLPISRCARCKSGAELVIDGLPLCGPHALEAVQEQTAAETERERHVIREPVQGAEKRDASPGMGFTLQSKTG